MDEAIKSLEQKVAESVGVPPEMLEGAPMSGVQAQQDHFDSEYLRLHPPRYIMLCVPGTLPRFGELGDDLGFDDMVRVKITTEATGGVKKDLIKTKVLSKHEVHSYLAHWRDIYLTEMSLGEFTNGRWRESHPDLFGKQRAVVVEHPRSWWGDDISSRASRWARESYKSWRQGLVARWHRLLDIKRNIENYWDEEDRR